MLATLILAMTVGAAPVQHWQLQITMTMGASSKTVPSGPPTTEAHCKAMRSDLLTNKSGMERAGGVKISARCVAIQ